MGGKVAMELAFNHSYLLKAFIIADISPRKYEPKHRANFKWTVMSGF